MSDWSDWSFWKDISEVVLFVGVGLFFILKSIASIKPLLPVRAKPRLLSVKDCIFNKRTEVFGLTLWIDNSAGQKDCSIIGRKLTLSNGDEIELDDVSLPITIIAGRAEEIIVTDLRHKQLYVDLYTGESTQKKYLVPPDKGTIEIKFNTGKLIRKKINFDIV